MSAEQVLAWDPDWVIASDARFFATAPADPVWGTLRAVRDGRIVLAPSLPYGWIDAPPSVNRLLGLVWLPVLFGADGGYDGGASHRPLRPAVRPQARSGAT